jgi:hypothetical protein
LINIIIKDHRPEQAKRASQAMKDHFKGRYWQECKGERFRSRFTKKQIRRIWERQKI